MLSDLYSIVIPAYNSYERLKALLEDIFRERDLYPPSVIIIIDDASTDETSYLPKMFDSEILPIKYKRMPSQQGPLLAEKAGIEMVETDIFVSIHADVRLGIKDNDPNKHPIDKIVCYLHKASKLSGYNPGVVAPWTLQLEAPFLIQGGPRSRSNEGVPISTNRKRRFLSLVPIESTKFETVHSIDSYCYVMYKHIFDEAGGFDTEFSPYLFYHDDLFARVRLLNYNIFTTSQVLIYHPHAQIHKTNEFKSLVDEEIFEKNSAYFKSKWDDNEIWTWNSKFTITSREFIGGISR